MVTAALEALVLALLDRLQREDSQADYVLMA